MSSSSAQKPVSVNANNNDHSSSPASMNGQATNDSTAAPLTSPRPGLFARFRRRDANPTSNNKMRRSFSAPAAPGRRRRRRRLLVEDHYRVDPERRVVLPGVPQHDPNWARDLHDFFNLIVLIPVVALNVMNWNWDLILKLFFYTSSSSSSTSFSSSKRLLGKVMKNGMQQSQNLSNLSLQDAWTGEWFEWFFYVTVLYFAIDLMWILVVPKCVKSPATIVQHHVATMLYILIPYFLPKCQWCMGACMMVEINTWFLIARRVFNKQGFPPWIIDLSFFSIRVKLISVFFYITWITIRCIVYPYLMVRFYRNWIIHSEEVGTPWNLLGLSVPLHACFCLLNFKWTYDLLMSKIRFWTRKNKKITDSGVDKGL